MESLSQKIWLSISEACSYLGISRPTLYVYMKDGRLPYYYLAGTKQRRLKKEDLDALLVRGSPEEADLEDSE